MKRYLRRRFRYPTTDIVDVLTGRNLKAEPIAVDHVVFDRKLDAKIVLQYTDDRIAVSTWEIARKRDFDNECVEAAARARNAHGPNQNVRDALDPVALPSQERFDLLLPLMARR